MRFVHSLVATASLQQVLVVTVLAEHECRPVRWSFTVALTITTNLTFAVTLALASAVTINLASTSASAFAFATTFAGVVTAL